MAEIFQTHERLSRDTRPPRMLRTLGLSLIAHALVLAAFVYVPGLRDTFTLASTLSSIKFVEEDYTKTVVGQRATIINLADDKLYYPAGYFLDPTALPAPDAPVLISEARPVAFPPTPRPKRFRVRPTPTPATSPTPESETVAGNKGRPPADPKASPTPPADAAPQTAEEAERIAKEANVEKFPTINTKPLTDLLKQGKELKDAGQIDLTGTLEMEVEADREEDGRLSHVVVTGAASSNAKLTELATAFIAAVSDSKLLAALKGTRHLKMKVKSDDKEIDVRVLTEMTSADEATKMSSGYNGLLFIGALSKKGKDEEALFKSVKVAAEAKQIVLTFNMPRKTASELLTKLIKKNETPPPPG